MENSSEDYKKGVYISTYGCQMNDNDTERMYSLLEISNFTPVTAPEQADLIIINSCSVREKPVHKVHSEVGRYKKLKKKNPHLKIGVGGCVGSQEKSKLTLDQPLIDFVFGPDNIDELPQIVSKAYTADGKVVQAKFYNNEPYLVENMVRNPGISTFVNITKGCDNFCTFCVVPFTRGRERSRDPQSIIEEVNDLWNKGFKEITLLGQNVDSYLWYGGGLKKDFSKASDIQKATAVNFSQLLELCAKAQPKMRIRFSTSNPQDLTLDVIETMAKFDNICKHIHLPVQSGSNRILKEMNRLHTREEYFELIDNIRRILPECAISQDLIAGFPTETEQDHQDTLSLMDYVKYNFGYMFTYSERPGT
ncbi:MAG: tRNA (N6-isopentenyl adenosine(37)-C2)-methylthiotransferase MiaB, partial [Gelidibacter sp.]|nr:tRNA (N6-isopentenyl adenosine(37)-C2)-methylthiotransferase MiaB [Gelidibacter sp.]